MTVRGPGSPRSSSPGSPTRGLQWSSRAPAWPSTWAGSSCRAPEAIRPHGRDPDTRSGQVLLLIAGGPRSCCSRRTCSSRRWPCICARTVRPTGGRGRQLLHPRGDRPELTERRRKASWRLARSEREPRVWLRVYLARDHPWTSQQAVGDGQAVGDREWVDDIAFGHAGSHHKGTSGTSQRAEERGRDPLPSVIGRDPEGDQLIGLPGIARRLHERDAHERVTDHRPRRPAAGPQRGEQDLATGGGIEGGDRPRSENEPLDNLWLERRHDPGNAALARGWAGRASFCGRSGSHQPRSWATTRRRGRTRSRTRAIVSSERVSARRWSSESGRPAFGGSSNVAGGGSWP